MEKVVKTIGVIIVLSLCGMFVIRCILVADKSAFSSPSATDALKSAYADGESLTYTVEISPEMAEDGYFSAYGFYYNVESGEVQFAVRWNNSVYDYTDMEKGYEYTFLLRNETTGEEYAAVSFDSTEKFMYNYRHLKAEGVSIGENDEVTAIMELRDGFESRQVIKYGEQPMEEYKIKSGFKKELMS